MNMKKRFYHRLNMFYTLLLSTILPCVLATLLLALVFVPMMKSVANTTDEAYEDVIMSAAVSRMEIVLDMVEDQERQFLHAKWLRDLYYDHLLDEPMEFEMKQEIVFDLARMVAENPALYSVSFRFYNKPESLYTSIGVFEDVTFLQEQYPETVYYRFFMGEAETAGYTTIEFAGKTYLLYYAPFSHIVAGGRAKGVVNILLRPEILGSALTAASENQGQRFALLDGGGTELWAYGEANPDADSVTMARSLGGGTYSLSMEVPRQIGTRTEDRVMPRIVMALSASLLISLVLSYLLSRFTYRPIQTVVERFVTGDRTGGNELLALQQVFEKMLDEKSLAEASLAHLRPMARQKLLSGLLDGTAFLEDSVEDQMHYCRVLFDYEYCNVIAVSLPFAQVSAESCTTDLVMETLTEHLCREIPIHAFVYSQDTDNFRILVNYDSWDYMQSFLSVLLSSCKEYFRGLELEQQVFLGVGQAVESPEDLYRAAEQAETAVNVAALNRLEQPMFYSEVAPELDYEYFYPFADELLLSRTISNCNTVSAKALLNTIIEENKRKSKLAPKCLQLLYMDIYSTLSRSGRSLGIAMPPAEPEDKLANLDVIQRKLENLIDEICQQIAARRSKTIRPGEQKILTYIEEHLYDTGLSLNNIAAAFGMSNAYISTLIKNHYETNYCNYVNRARVVKAIQLMTEEGLDINAVYPLVGYTNLSTFRRNYSKYAGNSMSPEELLEE